MSQPTTNDRSTNIVDLARYYGIFDRVVLYEPEPFYGKVDDKGIRCCYHGWQFDVQGHCVDQPCEPRPARRFCMLTAPASRPAIGHTAPS